MRAKGHICSQGEAQNRWRWWCSVMNESRFTLMSAVSCTSVKHDSLLPLTQFVHISEFLCLILWLIRSSLIDKNNNHIHQTNELWNAVMVCGSLRSIMDWFCPWHMYVKQAQAYTKSQRNARWKKLTYARVTPIKSIELGFPFSFPSMHMHIDCRLQSSVKYSCQLPFSIEKPAKCFSPEPDAPALLRWA